MRLLHCCDHIGSFIHLPDAVYALHGTLVELRASGNKLAALDGTRLLTLTHLEALDVACNNIGHVPAVLALLPLK